MYIPAVDTGYAEVNPKKRYVRIVQEAYLQVRDKPPGPNDANYSALIEVGVDSNGRMIICERL
jgi:hypothetical protein